MVAEAKWTNRPLTPVIINDLDTYKISALRQSGLKVITEPRIILASKAGYSDSLIKLAAASDRIELVDVAAELTAQRPVN